MLLTFSCSRFKSPLLAGAAPKVTRVEGERKQVGDELMSVLTPTQNDIYAKRKRRRERNKEVQVKEINPKIHQSLTDSEWSLSVHARVRQVKTNACSAVRARCCIWRRMIEATRKYERRVINNKWRDPPTTVESVEPRENDAHSVSDSANDWKLTVSCRCVWLLLWGATGRNPTHQLRQLPYTESPMAGTPDTECGRKSDFVENERETTTSTHESHEPIRAFDSSDLAKENNEQT